MIYICNNFFKNDKKFVSRICTEFFKSNFKNCKINSKKKKTGKSLKQEFHERMKGVSASPKKHGNGG